MLANLAADNLAVLSATVGQNVLDEVVSKLITSNYEEVSNRTLQTHALQLTIDQRHTRTIRATFANTLQVPVQEVGVANLEALLNDFRRVLIHAVLSCEAEDVVDGAAAIGGSTMLTNVLNAPVTELASSNDIDACKNLIDARTL